MGVKLGAASQNNIPLAAFSSQSKLHRTLFFRAIDMKDLQQNCKVVRGMLMAHLEQKRLCLRPLKLNGIYEGTESIHEMRFM
jgi:hypothetical protein